MRKAFAPDMILIIPLIIAAFISIPIIFQVGTEITSSLQNNTAIQNNTLATQSVQDAQTGISTLDSSIALLFFGMLIGLDLTAVMINSRPAFLIIGVISLFIGTVIIFNIMPPVTESMTAAGLTDNMSITSTLMTIVPYAWLVNAGIFLILFYAKTGEEMVV